MEEWRKYKVVVKEWDAMMESLLDIGDQIGDEAVEEAIMQTQYEFTQKYGDVTVTHELIEAIRHRVIQLLSQKHPGRFPINARKTLIQ